MGALYGSHGAGPKGKKRANGGLPALAAPSITRAKRYATGVGRMADEFPWRALAFTPTRPMLTRKSEKGIMSRVADPTAKISLLRAAEAVFSEKGPAAAKVEEITQRAGLSKGAFYLHFVGKEDAFREVVESFLARCSAVFCPPGACAVLPSSAADILAFSLERDTQMYEFFWQNRAILSIVGSCRGPHAYLLDAFRKEVAVSSRSWVDLLKKMGLFRKNIDSELVSTLLCGALHELVHKMLSASRKPPLAEWLRQAQEVLVEGLGTPALCRALRRESAPLRRRAGRRAS